MRDGILDGYEIVIRCKKYPCMNSTRANLSEVARRHGLDWEWLGQRWPYRCTRCGSRDVGMTLLPDVRPNTSPDRRRDLVAQIEEGREGGPPQGVGGSNSVT
jgi:hypothetical protein